MTNTRAVRRFPRAARLLVNRFCWSFDFVPLHSPMRGDFNVHFWHRAVALHNAWIMARYIHCMMGWDSVLLWRKVYTYLSLFACFFLYWGLWQTSNCCAVLFILWREDCDNLCTCEKKNNTNRGMFIYMCTWPGNGTPFPSTCKQAFSCCPSSCSDAHFYMVGDSVRILQQSRWKG